MTEQSPEIKPNNMPTSFSMRISGHNQKSVNYIKKNSPNQYIESRNKSTYQSHLTDSLSKYQSKSKPTRVFESFEDPNSSYSGINKTTIQYKSPKTASFNLINRRRRKIFTKTTRNIMSEDRSNQGKNTGSNHSAIDELRSTLASITLENEKLRMLSKEIMLDSEQHREMASTVHSFYQNVMMVNSEQNVMYLKQQIEELKKKISDLTADNLKLKEENKKLKSATLRYRNIALFHNNEIQDSKVNKSHILHRNNNEQSIPSIKDFPYASTKKDDSLETSTIRSIEGGAKIQHTSTVISDDIGSIGTGSISLSHASKENVHLEMIATTLKRISKCHSLKGLIETMYRELSILLKVHKIGIFILDPDLRKLFTKEQGLCNTVNIGKTNADLAINPAIGSIKMKAAFISIQGAKHSIRKPEVIVLPVLGTRNRQESEVYLAVQLEKKVSKRHSKNLENELWIRNEMVLNLICNHAGTILDRLLNTFEMELESEFQSKVLRFCSDLCGERSQQYLSAIIEEALGKCFNFEKACLLNYEDDKLFTLQCTRNERGEIFVEGMSEIPTGLGLTGKSIVERQMIISMHGKDDASYSAQTDNMCKVKRVENVLIMPLLIDSERTMLEYTASKIKDNKMLVGIVQFVNFNGDITCIRKVFFNFTTK